MYKTILQNCELLEVQQYPPLNSKYKIVTHRTFETNK